MASVSVITGTIFTLLLILKLKISTENFLLFCEFQPFPFLYIYIYLVFENRATEKCQSLALSVNLMALVT